MVASHAIPSGFATVSDDELTTVNGGIIPFVVAAIKVVIVVGVVVAALARPTKAY